MPLVTPGDSNKIQIEAELIDNISKKLDVIDREIDGLTAKRKAREAEAARASVTAAKSATTGWTEFRSMYSTVLDVVRVGQQVWQETGQKFVDYAAQVRDVSRSLGASAEESSRLVQVADDVGVSYSALTTSLKMAQKDGIDPSIDGLAKLSDQYLSLAPGVERTQFLLDNFGKSGAEMGKLMEQGGAGIREMSGAIDDSMILTQKALDQARDFEIAQDSMNDTWDAFTYQVAPPLVSAMTDIINHYRDIATSLEENGYWYTLTHQLSLDDIAAKREASDAALRASESNTELSASQEDNVDASKAQEEAVKAAQQALDDYKDKLEEVSKANQDAESFIQSYADSQKDYVQSHADAAKSLQEAIKSGDKEAIAEAQQGIQELEATWHESTTKMVYDMALAKVELNGYTDAEFAAMQRIAVEKGIRTQEEADQAIRMMEEATAIAEGVAADEAVIREQSKIDAQMTELEKQAEIAKTGEVAVASAEQSAQAQAQFAGIVDSATLSLIRQAQAARTAATAVASIGSGGVPRKTGSPGTGGIGPVGGGSDNDPKTPYANGGEFVIPMAYGYEGFRLGNHGTASAGETVTITPKGESNKGGNTYNITVYNPKKETTEESERKQLQKLSYLGVSQ